MKGVLPGEGEALWNAATDVKPEHDAAAEVAGRGRAAFHADGAIIREARERFAGKLGLKEIIVRLLERVLLNAAKAPMTNLMRVRGRIAVETAQANAPLVPGVGPA